MWLVKNDQKICYEIACIRRYILVLYANYLHTFTSTLAKGGSDLLTLRDSCLFSLELNMMHNLWETNGVQTEQRQKY
jgi:hypothetical protein